VQCQRIDQLVTVPAAYHGGRSVAHVQVRHYGPGRPLGHSRGTAVTLTGLAAQLAPPAQPKSWITPAAWLGVAGFLELVALRAAVLPSTGDNRGGAVAAMLLLAMAMIGVGAWAAARYHALTMRGPAASRALQLWRYCWYCRRCDIVTLPLGPKGRRGFRSHRLGQQLLAAAGNGPELAHAQTR
jgi:hypothetical protein